MLYLMEKTTYYSKLYRKNITLVHIGQTGDLFDKAKVFVFTIDDLTKIENCIDDDAFITHLQLEDIF